MKPRTLWFSRDEGSDYAQVFTSRPRKAVNEGEPQPCGVDCCGWKVQPGAAFTGRRAALDTLCVDGLRAARISIKPGQLLQVTISAEVVE